MTPQTTKPLTEIRALREMRLRYIYRALFTKNWNRAQTAKALSINVRSLTMYIGNMRELGWVVPKSPYATHTLKANGWVDPVSGGPYADAHQE